MNKPHSRSVRNFHLAILTGSVAWTIVLYVLYAWALSGERNHFDEAVRLKAESIARHTQALRSWVGGHGGIYAEVGSDIKPLPLLKSIEERDVMTPSGRHLTLLNSPAVLRMVLETFENSDGDDRVKLVSERPMHALNKPDQWEIHALKKLMNGEEKVEAFVGSDDESYFRLAYPMENMPQCQKCHGESEEEAKILGALSVVVDKTPYDELHADVTAKISTGYLSVCCCKLLETFFSS